MEQFDFTAPAEVYSSKGRGMTKRPMMYRRFATGGEAVRYVIEALASEMRPGTVVEAGDARFTADDIKMLYDSPDYPLPRTVSSESPVKNR